METNPAMKTYQCIVCGFVYDEAVGMPDEGIAAGTKWADIPAWNQMRTQPGGPQTILGRAVKTTGVLAQFDAYGRKGFSDDSLGKSDGTERKCDFFALRDIWTDPKGPHFDELVNEFVEIYAFYLETIGVDGLRIDTVKHVHRGFWDAFTARLRTRLGPEAIIHPFLQQCLF